MPRNRFGTFEHEKVFLLCMWGRFRSYGCRLMELSAGLLACNIPINDRYSVRKA